MIHFGTMQFAVEEYKRQIGFRRITSNEKRVRSLQREERRLWGKRDGQ